MSYRSLKRVLGETSLERKCRFLFGACLLVLIAASFWFYHRQTQALVFERNSDQGRLLVDLGLNIVHWKAWGGDQEFIDYWSKKNDSMEYVWRAIIPERPESPNQSYWLSEENRCRDEEEQRWVADFDRARRNQNQPVLGDSTRVAAEPGAKSPPSPEFETTTSPEKLAFRERLSRDKAFYEYYQPIYCAQGCNTACHNTRLSEFPITGHTIDRVNATGRSTAYEVGDLMAVIHVRMPNKRTKEAMDWNRAVLIATAVITVFLAMVASYLIVRYVIVKPLKHLRDVSDAIGHGNTSLRAEIHTGDEFEALGVAFNRMLRHLINAQEELRQVNVDLDGKVDELAQANMRLYEMNRVKSDFLATMSHELRTPLNSILGFSDVLVAIDSLNDKQRRYVQNIQKSGRTLLEMINDILDLAKMESGRFEIRPGSFAIEQVVGAQYDMARPLAEKKNIDLVAEIQSNLPPLHQDQGRVQQILNNLLSNAIKFTPEGGRIKVAAGRNEADELILQVSDTGVGIATEELDVIFEKFRQGGGNVFNDGDAMTREYSGSGLGLSIVRELCKLLGGEVSVESRLGHGSTFTVHLPWTLAENPRLDSPMSEEFGEFVQMRVGRLRGKPKMAPQATAAD
ncbi:MAG: HAMP domain-containing histidine kinase [Pirellulaceae bacterium]|nr:HAMP domain-containing histidine kinase [Pirellulaceae bacterium]